MKKLLKVSSFVILFVVTSISNCSCKTSKNINRWKNFYVLGDSLSDIGAFTGAGSIFFNNFPFDYNKHSLRLMPPYFENRSWSNGPVSVELVCKKLKLNKNLKPGWNFNALNSQNFSQIGSNYAFGGAMIREVRCEISGLFLNKFNFYSQICSLLNQHQIYENDLIFVNIGSNDLMWIIDHNIKNTDKYLENIISDFIKNLMKLINGGCKNIIIANISNMGLTPSYKEKHMREMTDLVSKYNKILKLNIKKLSLNFPNAVLKEYDVNSKFVELLEKFKSRGSKFENINATVNDLSVVDKSGILQPKYVNGANINNIDNYFFLDQSHPTRWIHEQFANDLYNFIMREY